jgi:glycosyltransferase involved in cell wall biosynthesis
LQSIIPPASVPSPTLGRDPTIAVVHDWLDTWAGGEQCLAQILALYPHSELFALVDFFPPEFRARIGGRRAHTSFLQHLPGARAHFRRLLPLFPAAIERLDISRFDLVISSSHAVAKGVRTHPRQLHLCYCYTPIRYAWDLREQYLAQVGLAHGIRGALVRRLLDRIREWDRTASSRVQRFVAISEHVARRIERCYDRPAIVVYPPVSVLDVPPTEVPRRAYLTVSRLVPYKRIDLMAAAFRMLPDRELIVIGEGPERRRIEASAGPNVRLLGEVPDAERDAWLGRARAFVFAAEEDFGIAPVEAQAFGTPVIAYGAGGATETIRGLDAPSPTGVFFVEQTPAAIAAAVRDFEAHAERISAQACRDNAKRFAVDRFRREFAACIASEWTAFAARQTR